jgi:hypothetical protein
MNQDRLVNLVSPSELQIQLFRGLLVVRTVEEHDAIGADPRPQDVSHSGGNPGPPSGPR